MNFHFKAVVFLFKEISLYLVRWKNAPLHFLLLSPVLQVSYGRCMLFITIYFTSIKGEKFPTTVLTFRRKITAEYLQDIQ